MALHWRGLGATGDASGRRTLWRAALRTARTLLGRPAVLIAVAAGVVAAVVLAAANLGPIVIALVLFSPIAATWIMLVATSLVSASEWFGRESVRVRAAMLMEGRCPSCDYDLSGVEPSADGCTVCPECSAAWAMDSPKYDLASRRVVVMPPTGSASDLPPPAVVRDPFKPPR
ncbi:MAG: hypothetical protein AMXMBFR58_11610 [Phycisphaerae bacterium]